MARVTMLKPAIAVIAPIAQSLPAARVRRIRGRRGVERRNRWLSEHPLCVECAAMTPRRTTVAMIVDHIIPLEQGGADDESNFQSLCAPHHDQKTAREATPR